MIKIDLITGFLGSGKTTFIKKYARHFMDQGQKVGILENDYGAVNVDMLLLNELRGDNCELEMVAGACDAHCHARRFKTKLIAMAMSRYDRVIVEPSGIFDVDEFFDVLRDDPLERWYEIGNVIAIVDARLEDDLSEDSDFYLASQVANAGIILLSRTQLTDQAHIDATRAHLLRAAAAASLKRPLDTLIETKDWNAFTAEDFRKIAESGYQMTSYVKRLRGQEGDYSSIYFMELPITRTGLKERIETLMNSDSCGKVFRLKGFFREEDRWYEVNATRKELEISPIPAGQQVLIVIGENLQEEAIKQIVAADSDYYNRNTLGIKIDPSSLKTSGD